MGAPMIPEACFNCRNLTGLYLKPNGSDEPALLEQIAVVSCNAYPTGIPEAIQDGENMHREPIRGDNGIQFELAEV